MHEERHRGGERAGRVGERERDRFGWITSYVLYKTGLGGNIKPECKGLCKLEKVFNKQWGATGELLTGKMICQDVHSREIAVIVVHEWDGRERI